MPFAPNDGNEVYSGLFRRTQFYFFEHMLIQLRLLSNRNGASFNSLACLCCRKMRFRTQPISLLFSPRFCRMADSIKLQAVPTLNVAKPVNCDPLSMEKRVTGTPLRSTVSPQNSVCMSMK